MVYGEAEITRFQKKYAASRKPLGRFLAIARAADWPHSPAVKKSFPATDYLPETGKLVFDIGGNKYRLIALVNFERRTLLVDSVLTHEEYDRKV